MKRPTFKAFRVRRAARQAGHADTLHELEWLGGEALVAPLPAYATRTVEPVSPPRVRHGDDVCSDWFAL